MPVFPGKEDRQFSLFPSELSDDARRAVTAYMQEARGYANSDTLQRTSRVVGSLALFMKDHLPPRAYDAAALMPIAEQIQHPRHARRYRAASDSLYEYFHREKPSRSRLNGYVGTLLGDLPYLDKAARSYTDRVQQLGLAMPGDTDDISPEEWINFTVGANIPEIARIHSTTNVESQLIMAADAVDRIMYAPDDDQILLDSIIRAESMHSVALEVYGFHAFDMMLQSAAGKLRVLKSGREQTLEQVSTLLGRAKEVSIEDILHQFFDTKPKEHLFQTAQESLYDEEIMYSSTPLGELTNSDQQGEVHARFKTVGKYALKLLRNPNYQQDQVYSPTDLFGMLAVVANETELGELFKEVVTRAHGNDDIDFTTAASKKKPLFIQGSPDYVRDVCERLPSDILRHLQVKVIKNAPADHIYQVAKFTCNLQMADLMIPVEFQFQTVADRANARLGKPSHMSHNAKRQGGSLGIITGSPGDLHTIYNRKHSIDPDGEFVNSQSIPHGEEFRRLYLRSRRPTSE